MVTKPAAAAEKPSGAGSQAVASTAVPAGVAQVAGQIEHAHPGYHVWTSDAGWWYATRTQPWAHGQAATVHAPGPGELSAALAEEEAATIGRAMTRGW